MLAATRLWFKKLRCAKCATPLPPPPAPLPYVPFPIRHYVDLPLDVLYNGARYRIKESVLQENGFYEDKIFEIEIKPGCASGTEISFSKVSWEAISKSMVDVIFVIQDKPHEMFMRSGDQLSCHVRIPLTDALASSERGPVYFLDHLDGREIIVPYPEGFIKPGSMSRVKGEGWSTGNRWQWDEDAKEWNSEKGDLLVYWEIVYPERLTAPQVDSIMDMIDDL